MSENDAITYTSYLKVDELLSLQQVQSKPAEHDETLFIIIHQVYELWFKQVLHEIEACARALNQNDAMRFLKCIKRVNAIQDTLINQVGILETMTPNDFNRFRERLNPASGFQSAQFRLVEYRLGAKFPEYLNSQRAHQANFQMLQAAINKPSLYDNFMQYLAKRGFAIPEEVLKRDVSKPYEANDEVRKIFLSIYDNQDQHADLFLVLEAMLDLDQKFLLWRYRHVSMVERMIGGLRGTGGSTGVKYLSTTLVKKFFPEIWQVRNAMY